MWLQTTEENEMQKTKDRDVDQYIQRIDEKNTHGWYVSISYNETGKHSKLFSDSSCGGKWQAKTKAIEYADNLHLKLFGSDIPTKVSHLRIVQ